MFSRRHDQLRSALATLSGRSKDYTQTALHRFDIFVIKIIYNDA